MNTAILLQWTEQILCGQELTPSQAYELPQLPDESLWDLTASAHRIRRHYLGDWVHTCTIQNSKSGKCSEDCGFCSQSQSATTDAEVYPMVPVETMQEAAHAAIRSGVSRFSVVTAGRGLSQANCDRIAEAFTPMDDSQTQWCASLGILKEPALQKLKQAGISRFHHNLETARSHFDQICSTHSYEERVETVRAAQRVGMSVCSGGIFGLGESEAQVIEMALELRSLNVDSVPMNFLIPVPGTAMEHQQRLTPRDCLKRIAMFRMVLPQQQILICGGRENNLKDLHPLALLAGASGIMTGNYLTRVGRTVADDIAMLDALGMPHTLRQPQNA